MHSQIISATKFFPLYNLNFPVAQSVLSFEDGINCGAVLDKVIQLLRKDVAHVLCNVRVLQCISSSKHIHVKSPVSVSKNCLSTIPPIGLVTGQIPSSLSTNITSICAITASPMHATCPTKFLHDFISHGEERRLQTSSL